MKNIIKFTELSIALVLLSGIAHGVTFAEKTINSPSVFKAPNYSDVIFTSRFERTNMYQVASDFHFTRAEWIYTYDSQVVQEFRNNGANFVSVTINGSLPDDLEIGNANSNFEIGRVEDVNGNTISTVAGGAAFGTVYDPSFDAVYLMHAYAAVDTGADGVQHDGPGITANVRFLGGDYSETNLIPFSNYLWHSSSSSERSSWGITVSNKQHFNFRNFTLSQGGFDNLEEGLQVKWSMFLRNRVEDYHFDVQDMIEDYAGRPVSFSCNNGNDWQVYHNAFDYGLAELRDFEMSPVWFIEQREITRDLGKRQVYSQPIPSYEPVTANAIADLRYHTQIAIANNYGLGQHLMVPWDTFFDEDWDRHYGELADYAPMYALVRATKQYLDGYEDAVIYGPGIVDDRYVNWSPKPVDTAYGGEEVCAYVRAKPGDKSAPVVVHLVDWERTMDDNFSFIFRHKNMFESGNVKVKLITAKGYDQTAHRNARISGDYSGLIKTINLPVNSFGSVRKRVVVPKMNFRWGILVIEEN